MNTEMAFLDTERINERAAEEAAAMERLRRAETLTPRQVERLFNLQPGTLRNWRGQGIGPAYSKPSDKLVLYDVEDVRRYLAATRRRTRDQP